MPKRELEILFLGKPRKAWPIAANGLNLFAEVEGFTGTSVVLEFMAIDKQEFWDRWREFGGDRQDLRLPDGSKWEPPYPARRGFVARIRTLFADGWAALFPWTKDTADEA